MNAVSSFRPLDESLEYMANQIAAKDSWSGAFDTITFFNNPDDRMIVNDTPCTFIPCKDVPTIKELVECCASMRGWSCIINSDIIVSKRIKAAEMALQKRGCQAASSWRYNFNTARGPESGNVTDMGLDLFAAVQPIWVQCAEVIPDQFRIGHCFWDTWMLGFMNYTCRSKMADITPSRCIFHPIHGGRRSSYEIDTSFKSEYLNNCAMPSLKIIVANPTKPI